MPTTSSTLILLPTFQEADNIRVVLPRLRSAVPEAHILVIDDNSPDGTAALAEAAGRELGNIEVLRQPKKAGLGAAYRNGFEWALDRGFDVLVQMDADLSHDPRALPELLARRDEVGADLVIGSRYVPGGSIPDWPAHRRLLSKYGNLYVRLVLGLGVHDATTGFRAWRAAAVKDLGITATSAEGYGFMIESNYVVARAGHRAVEVPIRFLDRARGQSKMSGAIIVEALGLVTWWGVRDRVLRRRKRPTAS
jgi:dolichol-phosphate mannosyltransferase